MPTSSSAVSDVSAAHRAGDPLDAVLGQTAAIRRLRDAVRNDRMHHAWILHGPAGVGKRTCAMALGRWLLKPDLEVVPEVTDEVVNPLELVKATGDPNLHFVVKELATQSRESGIRSRKLASFPVEVIREFLIERVAIKAVGDATAPDLNQGALIGLEATAVATPVVSKVFIVDEAETLNPTSQNALLKTLEEPPAGTVLILITSSEDRLLPTIRSRCQRVGFVPLADDVLREWIVAHRVDGFPDDKIEWLVAHAMGSPGRALTAMRWGLHEWADRVEMAFTSAQRGRPDGYLGADMKKLIDGYAEAWVSEKHEVMRYDGAKPRKVKEPVRPNASKDTANKTAADLMWSVLAGHARLEIQKRVDQLSEAGTQADPIAGDAVLGPWLAVIDAIEHGRSLAQSNVNLALVCDYVACAIGEKLAVN